MTYDSVFFDFDGVLAESTDIKSRAFQALYEDQGSAFAERVHAVHKAREGISRLEKIRDCHRDFLGIELSDDELAVLGERYRSMVEDDVVACDWVPGAREFVEAHHHRVPLFVISGTPDDELLRVVERRHMRRFFVSVHGSPRRKEPIIRELLSVHGLSADRVLFVGDAMTDYDAAHATGLAFLGRVAPGTVSPFPAGTTTVPDLSHLTV